MTQSMNKSQTQFSFFIQSHASARERIFSIFFGLGYIAFLLLELILILEKRESACYDPTKIALCCLNIVFVALQGSLIFYYPRLKLNTISNLDRCERCEEYLFKLNCAIICNHYSFLRWGCLHLVGTNILFWIHIVINESIFEINHAKHLSHHGKWKLSLTCNYA